MFRVTEAFAISIPAIEESNVVRITEALLPAGGSTALEIKIAAIHEGLTRNKTYYTKEGLTHSNKDEQGHPGGLKSWLEPQLAPIIKNHDSSDVDNIIGRVVKAEWVEKQGKEPGHIELTASITNPDAIAKVMRGEYQTGSVGLDVDSAHCNICNADLQKEHWGGAFHEHMRGSYYKKAPKGHEMEGQWLEADKSEPGAKMAHILVGNVYGREYSMVVTPSDARSRVKSMELKEMLLTQESHESLNLMDPMFKESVADDVLVLPEVKTEEKTDRSIAELMKDLDLTTPLVEYARMGSRLAYNRVKPDIDTDFTSTEMEKLLDYILENNEDLEDELNDIRECVLSTETNAQLPDSSFAFVSPIVDTTEKLRQLPYKTESGVIDKTLLRTSLSLAGLILPLTEYTRVHRKLRAAAIKAGMRTEALTGDLLQEALTEAKSFLLENGQAIVEFESEPKELVEKLAAAEDEIATLRREALDRESELDTLTEQIENLGTEIAEMQDQTKATLVNAILTVDLIDETEKSAKMNELLALETNDLQVMLQERSSEQGQMYVSARVSRRGKGQDKDDNADTTEELKQNGGTVLAALLGSKSARKEMNRLVQGVRVEN